MLEKKKLENKTFVFIEFIETLVSQYLSILVGTIIGPRKTICKISISEKVSPLLLLVINVVIAALVEDASDSNSLFDVLLKSLILTTKPTWNDKLWSIFGLLLGTFLLILIMRAVSKLLTGMSVVLSMATKAICYGSFTFVPIVITKFAFTSVVFTYFYDLYYAAKENILASAIILTLLVFVIYWWWSFIVLLWLKSYQPDIKKPNRTLLYSILIFFALRSVSYNLDFFGKIRTVSELVGSDRYVTKSLEKNPPDYTSAAVARMLISDKEELSPYRRYCEKMKAVTYLANGIPLFDFKNALLALKLSKYELLEKYFVENLPKVDKSTLTAPQHRQVEFMETLINGVKKEKAKEGFNEHQYETSISFMKLPFYDTSNKYLRLIP